MGVVFRARQQTLNRLVAVKMILAGDMASSRDVNRFYTEAEAAARLKHPGIIAIHEIGEHNGLPYFSMELVEGPSLDDIIRDQAITCRESAKHLREVAEAIHYAHEHGVLHRDLKPSNILLDQDGHPKVADFGLAKQVEGGSDLTASGTVLGTPGFMPPEQALGKKGRIDKRSDIYSLGAILYALMTGRPPFRAETASATLLQVIHNEPVAPRALNPDINRDLETICLKCLAKESNYRYSTARELSEELGRYLQGEPIQAPPSGASSAGGAGADETRSGPGSVSRSCWPYYRPRQLQCSCSGPVAWHSSRPFREALKTASIGLLPLWNTWRRWSNTSTTSRHSTRRLPANFDHDSTKLFRRVYTI